MNYIELINQFWRLDELWQFNGCETRLYFYILKIANMSGWADAFEQTDLKVSAAVGVSTNTLKTARKRLIGSGLISVETGGKCYGNKSRYKVRYQNLTPNSIPNSIPNSYANSYANSQPNSIPNNKNKTKTKTETFKRNKKENSDLEIFEEFRKFFGGTKKGLDTEFENFVKKHNDWENVLPLLPPAVKLEIEWRAKASAAGAFVPQWKNLQTWINQRCWEQEFNFNFEKNGRNSNKKPITADDIGAIVAVGSALAKN
ncbi:MAG: hypothetical protein LBJ63_07655 [Prevotellaceae bacterium]|jgi:hypothetical protein|nr:hypothetical protein [Prevotellaceae bacterium]